jgi:hypothetical protein
MYNFPLAQPNVPHVANWLGVGGRRVDKAAYVGR